MVIVGRMIATYKAKDHLCRKSRGPGGLSSTVDYLEIVALPKKPVTPRTNHFGVRRDRIAINLYVRPGNTIVLPLRQPLNPFWATL